MAPIEEVRVWNFQLGFATNEVHPEANDDSAKPYSTEPISSPFSQEFS